MKRHIWKTVVVIAGTFAAWTAQPAVARAGLIADTWYAIFGPPGTPYFPGAYTTYYGPTYYSGYYTTGYRTECCRPAPVCCVPVCNPCPTVCDPCVTGGCPTVPATGSGQPPQTFKKPGTGSTEDPPQPDSKFKSRDDSSKFKPTDKNKKNGANGKNSAFPTPAGDGDGDGKTGTQRKAFRVPTKDPQDDDPPGPIIRQKKPVPAKAPVEKSSPKEKSDKDKEKQVPALTRPNFDDKVAWKPVLPKTRLIINARVSHPQLSRTVIDPNDGWKPVRNESRLVRK